MVADAPPEEAPPAVAPAPAPKPKAKPLAAKGKIAPAAQKCSTIPVGLSEGGHSPWWLIRSSARLRSRRFHTPGPAATTNRSMRPRKTRPVRMRKSPRKHRHPPELSEGCKGLRKL